MYIISFFLWKNSFFSQYFIFKTAHRSLPMVVFGGYENLSYLCRNKETNKD